MPSYPQRVRMLELAQLEAAGGAVDRDEVLELTSGDPSVYDELVKTFQARATLAPIDGELEERERALQRANVALGDAREERARRDLALDRARRDNAAAGTLIDLAEELATQEALVAIAEATVTANESDVLEARRTREALRHVRQHLYEWQAWEGAGVGRVIHLDDETTFELWPAA